MKKFMRGRILEFLILLMVAMGAGPVGAAFWQWSTNANTNASADPTINWAEGMAPSSVNDSARAMMAVMATWNKDSAGQLTSGGTASAYTLTTNTVYPNVAATVGQALTFIANNTNALGATLNVDGTGALPMIVDGVLATIPAGTIQSGGVYTVTNTGGFYRLRSAYGNPYNIPLGSVTWSTLPNPPNGNFLPANGQCISTSTYAAYWVALGSPASGGCAGGFFAIADLRGRVVAGLDTIGVAANRLTSSPNGCGTAMTSVGAVCANGAEAVILSATQIPTINSSANNSISVTSTVTNIVTGTVLNNAATTPSATRQLSNDAGSGVAITSTNASQSISVSSTNTGGGAHPIVQPTMALMPYIRVL